MISGLVTVRLMSISGRAVQTVSSVKLGLISLVAAVEMTT